MRSVGGVRACGKGRRSLRVGAAGGLGGSGIGSAGARYPVLVRVGSAGRGGAIASRGPGGPVAPPRSRRTAPRGLVTTIGARAVHSACQTGIRARGRLRTDDSVTTGGTAKAGPAGDMTPEDYITTPVLGPVTSGGLLAVSEGDPSLSPTRPAPGPGRCCRPPLRPPVCGGWSSLDDHQLLRGMADGPPTSTTSELEGQELSMTCCWNHRLARAILAGPGRGHVSRQCHDRAERIPLSRGGRCPALSGSPVRTLGGPRSTPCDGWRQVYGGTERGAPRSPGMCPRPLVLRA